MAHIEDRWMKTGPTGRKIKSERHGTGLRWLAVWNERDGRRRKKGFATKDAAQAHLDAVGHQQRSGTYISADRSAITVREFSALWLAEQIHQRSSSITAIKTKLDNQILPALGDYPLADLEREVIQAAVTRWAETLAPTTVEIAYRYLVGMLHHAVRDRRMITNPCVRINLPSTSKGLVVPPTVEQVQGLIEHLPEPFPRFAVLVAASGLRGGEARGLEWDRVRHVDEGAVLKIDRQWSRGGWAPVKTESSDRSLSVGVVTRDALGGRGDGPVFVGRGGAPISDTTAWKAWRVAAPKVGLDERGGWHQLRHFHASLLIAGGASPVAVAGRLGHKNAIETLKTYGHLWPDDDVKMRDASDGVVSWTPPQPPG